MKFFKYLILLVFVAIVLQAFSDHKQLKVLNNDINPAESIACPTIDITNSVIKQPACNKNDGSITGIKVISTGTKVLYTWRDESGSILGHTVDLTNIPAGTYTLEVTDNSGCTALTFTSPFVVTNLNGINIDESKVLIKSSTCKNDGSITGLTVTGATTYEWHDLTTNTIASTSTTTADLLNAAPGEYQLNTFNSSCQMTSQLYYINSTLQLPRIVDFKIKSSDCGAANGSIRVSLNVVIGSPRLNFYFSDPTGNHLLDGLILGDISNPVLTVSGLQGGVYYLYVYDNNGCQVLLGTYDLGLATFTISTTESVITNDRCNQHLASIVPIFIGGGAGSQAWQYIWTDAVTGQVVGRNKVLTRVGAGSYKLKAVSSANCQTSTTFTVINVSPALVPPIAAGSTICLPGIINITVTNPDTAEVFRLYASPTDSIPIDSNKNGIFYKQVDETTDFYVSRVHKDCESDRTKVTETVVVSIKIPNAFTPNNDGINDTWNIAGIDKFPGADVKIFTRYGKLIFHSINYPVAFNGTYNGSRLPSGVYYYILDVKQPICYGKISGSLTIIY